MPGLRSETYGTGDQTWLGSTHGIYNCRSGNLDVSVFTAATHYPDGHLLSGIPLGKITATDQYVPWDPAYDADPVTAGQQGDGREVLAGFLFTDVRVNGTEDLNAAVLVHGTVNVDHLPVAFTPPADRGAFVFVGAGV